MAIVKKAKLTCGIMWADVVSTQFAHSLSQLLLYSQHHLCEKHEYIYYHWAKASYHELARQELVDNMEGSMLLSLDTDHSFAPDLLTRLLYYKEREKAQVISGIYTYKNPPYAPVANVWGEHGQIIPIAAWDPTIEVMKVGPVGGGCLLVDREVFNRIKHQLKQAPFHIIQGLSEDYSFAKRCQQLGIDIHLAMKVECHHLAPRNVLHISDYIDQFAPALANMKQVMKEQDQQK